MFDVGREGAEPSTNLEDERLQDVPLDGGGQQDHGRLWAVLVPVDVDAVALQQLQAALVRKHLSTTGSTTVELPAGGGASAQGQGRSAHLVELDPLVGDEEDLVPAGPTEPQNHGVLHLQIRHT